MAKAKEIIIDGTKYVPADSVISAVAETMDGKPYVIVRAYQAGVFAGYLDTRNGQEVTLLEARRLWYWDGAASLSQLAEDGVSKPKTCKFPKPVKKVLLLQAIEILDCTQKAKDSIAEVEEWKA